jgi:hypothetical protein
MSHTHREKDDKFQILLSTFFNAGREIHTALNIKIAAF